MGPAPPQPPPGRESPAVSRRARRLREAGPRAGDAREAALIDVARALVETGEFQGASIRRIAEQAGISRQGFYFYFQSKDELLAQLVTETLHSMRRPLEGRELGDAAETMRRLVAEIVAVWRRDREVLCATVELATRSESVLAHWSAEVTDGANVLVALISSATRIEALRDPAEASRTIATLIWMIERNCYMHMTRSSDETDAELAERLGELCVRALGLE